MWLYSHSGDDEPPTSKSQNGCPILGWDSRQVACGVLTGGHRDCIDDLLAVAPHVTDVSGVDGHQWFMSLLYVISMEITSAKPEPASVPDSNTSLTISNIWKYYV